MNTHCTKLCEEILKLNFLEDSSFQYVFGSDDDNILNYWIYHGNMDKNLIVNWLERFLLACLKPQQHELPIRAKRLIKATKEAMENNKKVKVPKSSYQYPRWFFEGGQ